MRLRLLAILPDKDAIAHMLHLPDRKRGKRRWACCFSGTQIEARVMPRAADAFANDEAFCEWTVVMAAMRVDGENFDAGAHQQDLLVADMAEQGLAGKVTRCDTQGEIRPGRQGLLFSHVRSPSPRR